MTGPTIADHAVTGPKIASNAVTGPKIADNSLQVKDIAVVTGVVPLDPPNQTLHQCNATGPIQTGHVVTGDLIFVSQPAGVAGAVLVTAREDAGSQTAINIVVCNVATASFDPPAAAYTWAVIDQ